MKKIIRGVLLGILALIIIGGAVGAYFLFGGKKPEISPQPYIVDNEGTSYLAVVDEEGVTYAAVTDNVGNIYAAEVDENGNIGETKGQINDQVDVAKLPTNYTGEHIEETADVNAFTGNAQVVEEPATQAPGTTEVSAPNTPTTQSSGNNNTATTKASGGNNGTQTTASGGNSGAGKDFALTVNESAALENIAVLDSGFNVVHNILDRNQRVAVARTLHTIGTNNGVKISHNRILLKNYSASIPKWAKMPP